MEETLYLGLLQGVQFGYSAVRYLKGCRDHQTSQMRADPDWRADRNRLMGGNEGDTSK